jgi:hypothetical protein
MPAVGGWWNVTPPAVLADLGKDLTHEAVIGFRHIMVLRQDEASVKSAIWLLLDVFGREIKCGSFPR